MGVTKYKVNKAGAEKLQRFVGRHGCDDKAGLVRS